MTLDELRRKNREILSIQTNEDNTNNDDAQSLGESNFNDTFNSMFSDYSSSDKLKIKNRILAQSSQQTGESDYSKGLVEAEEEGKWINDEFNRDELAEWVKVYSNEMQKSITNNDTVGYYKNQALLTKTQKQISLLTSGKSYASDLDKEVAYNLRNWGADVLLLGQKLWNDNPLNSNSHVSEEDLRNIYANKADDDVIQELNDLKKTYGDDELIQKLYDTVIGHKYIASDEYFKVMSKYATEKLKEIRYKESEIYKRTRDEKEDLQKLEILKDASAYTGLEKSLLDASGVVANMAPSIASGYIAGGIGTLAGASSGTVGSLTQAGSLSSMGASVYGGSFDRTLDEGYGWDKSTAYARINALIEVATELVGGETVMAGLGGFASHTMTSKVAQKLISKGSSPLAKFMIGMAWDIGAEAVEEMMSSAVMPIVDKTLLGKEITAEEYWLGILESARDSVIPTLILGGFGKARIVNHVTTIGKALSTKLDLLASQGAISEQEYTKMRDDLKAWTDDAIAGVTEHYEEMQNELGKIGYKEEYSQAMDNMNTALDQRGQGYVQVLQLASQLNKIQDMTAEEKQAKIEQYAENYGMDKAKLAEVFGRFKEVLPFSYQQAEETTKNITSAQNKMNNVNVATGDIIKKSIVNQAVNKEINKKIKEAKAKEITKQNAVTKTSFNDTFNKYAKVYPQQTTSSGVTRLVADGDQAGFARFKLGNIDRNDTPSYSEITSSPILVESITKENGRQLFIYDNFADFNKDVSNEYGSLKKFANKLTGRVITMSGKGGYEMSVEGSKIVWKDTSRRIEIAEEKKKPLNKAKNNKPVEKTQKSLYNRGRGDLNEQGMDSRKIRGNDEQRVFKDSKQAKDERIRKAEEWEESIKPVETSKLTEKQLKVKIETNNKYRKTLIFVEESNNSFIASASMKSPKKIYVTQGVLDVFGKRVILHEVMESDMRHNAKVGDLFKPIIDIIERDNMFEAQKSEFWESQDGEMPSDDQIAKDIICDIFSSMGTGEKLDYKILLSEETQNTINEAIEQYNEEIYNRKTTFKDSNQSSFSMLKNIEDEIQSYYRPSAMESTESPIVRDIEKIRDGKVQREEGRDKTSTAEVINMIQKFVEGRFGKLKGAKARTALGTHNLKSNWVRIKEKSDIDTAFHELGHYINDRIFKNAQGFSDAVDSELETLCEIRWAGVYKDRDVRLKEGFAEAVRQWVDDRVNFTAKYPAIAEMFEEKRNSTKELQSAFDFLDKLRDKVLDYENMTSRERFRALKKDLPEQVAVDNKLHQMGTKIFYNIFNDMVYANKLDRYVAKQLGIKYTDLLSIKKFEDNLRTNGNSDVIAHELYNGITDLNTGKKVTHGLGEVIEYITPSKEKAKEVGMSVDKLLAQNIQDVGDYWQLKRMKFLYEGERKTKNLGVLLNDVNDGIKEIEETSYLTIEQLEHATNLLNEDSQALINYAYEQGAISEEQRDELLNNNQFYAPLNRKQQERLGRKGNGGRSSKIFQHLYGSDSQLEDPFIAVASNWGTIIRKLQENKTYQMFNEIDEEVRAKGGKMGLWYETNVAPEVIKIAEAKMDVFKSEIRKELKTVQDLYHVNTFNGSLVELMNLDATASLFAPTYMNEKERVIGYKKNGKMKYIQFADNEYGRGMFTLLAGLDTASKTDLLEIASRFIVAPLKLGATGWNAEFAVSNMQSDAMMRYLNSDAKFIERVWIPYLTNIINATYYLKNKGEILPGISFTEESELSKKFELSGASLAGKFKSNKQNIMRNADKVFGKASKAILANIKDDSGKTNKGKINRMITMSAVANYLNWIPEVSEQATRFREFVSVYKKMIEKGFSEEIAIREAGMKARQVTQDFTVQGYLMRQINKVVPFASATVGGLYRIGQEARNHPARLSARLSALAIMTLFISNLIKGDDRDWYDEINEQKKFDNFIIPNPSGDKQHPIVIKKPQGPARYIINLVQLMYDVGMGYVPDDKVDDRFLSWLEKSYDDAMPARPLTDTKSLLPGFLQAIMENQLNLDFFYGTPIVPKGMENLDPRHQYDEYTGEFAQFIGNIFNVSPAKIDNILTKWAGGLGKQATSIANDITRIIKGKTDNSPARDKTEYMFGSKIWTDALRSSASVNEVYDRLEYLEREKAEGRMTAEEQQEYDRLQTAKSTMAQYNKQIKAIRADETLSATEKKDRIDELKEYRTDTARYYLGKSLLDSNHEQDIIFVDFYPSNDTYSYTVNKKKYDISFADEATKKEYAEMFKKEYEASIKKLHNSAEYKKATDEEKVELDKKAKTNARTSTTAKMKQIVYRRTYLNK